jgi:hypothetical protein
MDTRILHSCSSVPCRSAISDHVPTASRVCRLHRHGARNVDRVHADQFEVWLASATPPARGRHLRRGVVLPIVLGTTQGYAANLKPPTALGYAAGPILAPASRA